MVFVGDNFATVIPEVRKWIFFTVFSEDESSDDASGANILDLLDANSIPEVGGRVLALFPLEDLKAMKDRDLFLDIMSEIGKIPMSEMVYLISKDKFVELGNALAKEFDQDFRLDHLIMAGSLMYGMEDLVFESPEDFKTLVVEHMNGTDMKTVCLPSGRAMAFWGRVIEDAFS